MSLSYDPTGIIPENLIANEIHTPVIQPAIFPREGPFFESSISVLGTVTGTDNVIALELYTDFLWSPLFSLRTDSTGKDIYSYFILTNYTRWSRLSITYHGVGGEVDKVLLAEIAAAGDFDKTDKSIWLRFEGDETSLQMSGVDYNLKNTGIANLFSQKLENIATALRVPSTYLTFITSSYVPLRNEVNVLNGLISSWSTSFANNGIFDGNWATVAFVTNAINTSNLINTTSWAHPGINSDITSLTALDTSILNIGSGQVYKDAAGNVGIGTSSPSTKLTVNGAITITGEFALRGSYGAGARLSNFVAGDNALNNNTTGNFNTAIGASALQSNTTGNQNTANGNSALQSNTTGCYNTAIGMSALYSNIEGYYNTANGNSALYSNTTGNQNTASGNSALRYNTTGSSNAAIGASALESSTTGSYNTAIGVSALRYNTTGSSNTASGMSALYSNIEGYYNNASGVNALYSNTTGNNNTANGNSALQSNTTGSSNTASGLSALYANTTGNFNTTIGVSALSSNTTGSSNTAIGASALYANTTGSGNTALNSLNSVGTYAPVFNVSIENNRFCMGSTGVTNAYIQVAWTVVSDARDKTNFAEIPHGLEFVNKLKPTAYQYKEDRETDIPTGIVRYGFKAQDILALEGDTPVIIDTEDLNKLRFNSDSLIPVLVNAIKELTARLELLEGKL